jgi:transcriptional regulator with XRE-family HTH domain/GAF domain-containing protein
MSGIGKQIKEFREERKLSQRDLAKKCSLSHSYIALMEKGSRTPEQDKLLAICNALELNAAQTSELLQQVGHGFAPLAKVEKILSHALTKLPKDSCCTFHVKDPFWPKELRLVAMPGVRNTETMHGFVSPASTKRVLRIGDPETFSEDAANDPQRRDTLRLPDSIKDERVRRLFGDFVEREEIKSSARFVFREAASEGAETESVMAVLFVNFRVRTQYDSVREQLRELREALATETPAVAEALRRQDAPILQQVLRLLEPAQEWPTAGIREDDDALKQYFESILDTAMEAAGAKTSESIGTIHLYDAENDILRLAACRGSIDPGKIGNANVLDVSKGQGIITWVALKRRAVVIPDLGKSDFSKISVLIRDGVRSEIAVPMIAGGLTGVLNLESIKPGCFSEKHVRSLWYAANNAAVAARLYRQAITNRRLARLNGDLVSWCSNAIVRMHSKQSEPIAELSEIARASLGASHCGIWRFDANVPERFYGPGASYDVDSKTPPRKGGWSDYVCRAKCAVWITIPIPELPAVPSRFRFDFAFWDGRRQSWSKIPPKSGTPDSVNQRVITQDVRSELGIPILSENECVGVAWLKFGAGDHARVGTEDMLLATQFAEGVGRVLKSLGQSATQRIPIQSAAPFLS